jgi:hypothetical protein
MIAISPEILANFINTKLKMRGTLLNKTNICP